MRGRNHYKRIVLRTITLMTIAEGFGYAIFVGARADSKGWPIPPAGADLALEVCNRVAQRAVNTRQDVGQKPLIAETALDVPACVQLVRRGDEAAATALLNHLYPLVIKLVRAHRPRRTNEEDLAQTVFMKIFAKLDQFSGRVPLEHWVSRIAVNTCLNQINHERHRPELRWADLSEEEEAVVQSLVSTTEEFEASQSVAARELVSKLLAKLSPADRLVVTLMHLEGRSVEEVKKVTGWSGPLVKIRAFRARKKMKKHLQQLVEERIP